MIDNKTTNLQLSLPHRQNNLDEDVLRIRESFELLDVNAKKLQTAINTEEKTRIADDKKQTADFTKNLTTESTARSQADQALTEGISALQTSIQDESTARGQADQTESTARGQGDEYLANTINNLALAVTANNKLGNKKAGEGLVINGDTLLIDANASASTPIGTIQLLPFRNNELPKGYYFCNNDRYANTSPQGIALNSLSANFKSDWGISNNGSTINVPNFFYSGRGYFLRSANSSSRRIGTAGIEHDAIRNITGSVITEFAALISTTGCLSMQGSGWHSAGGGNHGDYSNIFFNASRTVATSAENRPLNVGMTPAIYLGV